MGETGHDLRPVEAQELPVHPDAADGAGQDFLFRESPHGRQVGLRQAVPRMRHALGEGAVVGEQHQPGTRGVQPAHRDERPQRERQEIHHRRAAGGIGARRQVPHRLVQDHMAAGPVEGAEPRPVHPDVRRLGVGADSGRPDDLAVHGDPALGDEPLGGAPGRDAGGGDEFLEPLRGHDESEDPGSSAPGLSAPRAGGFDSSGDGDGAAVGDFPAGGSSSRSSGRSSRPSSPKRSRNSSVVP